VSIGNVHPVSRPKSLIFATFAGLASMTYPVPLWREHLLPVRKLGATDSIDDDHRLLHSFVSLNAARLFAAPGAVEV
jgi:hypothetical protein